MNDTAQLLDKVINKLIDFSFDYGPKLLGATLMLLVGLLFARWAGQRMMSWLETKDLEPPVRTLIVRVLRLLIFALTLIIVLEKVGVAIAPLIAGLGVAGVGIGLAMQGVLGNLAAGLLIIFIKPFRVGDYVELVGEHGEVKTIELFSTALLHADGSRVVIPNRKVIGEILHNYGATRQLDLAVGVAYGADLGEAIRTVRAVLDCNPRVLKEPAPVVGVSALADSSIVLAVKPWVKLDDFVPAGTEIYEAVVAEFRARKIEIPFPQREVRVLSAAQVA
ncbi:MAG: mechanosensitive ion channel family protein [Verrucomicrobia bacterium]|nr:mechanosensitive ion channel family protein [Verrucomicrobiota bacterium]